jgi:hypothetical protein
MKDPLERHLMDGKNVVIDGKRYDPSAYKNAFIHEAQAAGMKRDFSKQYLLPILLGGALLLVVLNPSSGLQLTGRGFGALMIGAGLAAWRFAGMVTPVRKVGEYYLVLEDETGKRAVMHAETRGELEPYLRVFKRHMVNQSSSLEANVYDPPKPTLQAQVQPSAPKLGR